MNGFAGSERAGERRRRRLAVESEGSEQTLPRTSGIGDPLLRFFASTGREATQLTASNCPTLSVVTASAWKHWAVAVGGTAIGSGLVLAGLTWPEWGPNCGPGLSRLLKTTSSPLITWLYSLTLFVTAQGAALILWARSRSERDFHGNYRIWGWAAATWIGLSLAIATQAHLAFSETVLHHIRWRKNGAPLWCWLLPATAWGWGIALRLEPELRTDRVGHFLFLAAGGWYMLLAGVLCQQEFWPKACPDQVSSLLAAVFQLLGHASLFLSTSLHARYVLLYSAEPPQQRRRTTAKMLAAAGDETPPRRRWLGLLSWKRRTSAERGMETGDGQPKRGKKRATATAAKRRNTVRKSSRRRKSAEDGVEVEESERWNESEAEGWEGDASAEVDRSESVEREAGSPPKNYRFDGAEDTSGAADLNGLSKKDRRLVQQQAREGARQQR